MNIEAQQVSKCSARNEKKIMMTFLRNLLSKVLSLDVQRIQFFGNEAIFGFFEFY